MIYSIPNKSFSIAFHVLLKYVTIRKDGIKITERKMNKIKFIILVSNSSKSINQYSSYYNYSKKSTSASMAMIVQTMRVGKKEAKNIWSK
jgi:hypothetical protein